MYDEQYRFIETLSYPENLCAGSHAPTSLHECVHPLAEQETTPHLPCQVALHAGFPDLPMHIHNLNLQQSTKTHQPHLYNTFTNTLPDPLTPS